MKPAIIDQWYKVENTKIYTTGHYKTNKSEMKAIFQSGTFSNGENRARADNDEMITTKLKRDKRILFYFFPLKIDDKYLMEGNATEAVIHNIQKILPQQLKDILVEKNRVKYHSVSTIKL